MRANRTYLVILTTTTILQLFAINTHADYFTNYVWYRAMPDEDRILITLEEIWGHKAVDQFCNDSSKLEAEGKYLTLDYTPDKPERILNKSETLGGRKIDTEITIYYPKGNCRGGACAFIYVKVKIDNILRLHTPLGYNFDSDLTVPRVEIHSSKDYGFINATILYAPETTTAPQHGGRLRLWLDQPGMLKIKDGKLTQLPCSREKQKGVF